MGVRASRLEPLADRLHSVAIHLLRRVRKGDASLGLSAARLSALSVIVFAGPIRMSALAKAEQVRVPTMTLLAGALKADGLITRRSDPADARAVLLQATSKGAKLMAEGRRRRVAQLAAELSRLSATDCTRVHDAVEVLERLLDRSAR
jgi:DNA-binding MarR family transcriptional regulator